MSKICGIIAADERFDISEALGFSYQASWSSTYNKRELWHNNGAGLGHLNVGAVNLEQQPLLRGGDVAVYCGKVFDYTSLQNELIAEGAELETSGRDIDFLVELLKRRGKDPFRSVNGIFSLAVWNPTRRRLSLVSDRYGLRSLYYFHDKVRGVLVFASDLRGVMESGLVPRQMNWSACSNFLYFGHHLGDTTWFDDVHLLPPASVLTFENNEITIEKYWDLNHISINKRIDYSTVVKECGRLFEQAISRQNIPVSGRKAVFLSGGLDSRRIAAELKKQGECFDTYTAGWDFAGADPKAARQVADIIGVNNTLVPFPERNFMVDYWPHANALMDYETKLHQWILPLVEALPESVKVNYDGLAGDIPFNGMRRDSPFADISGYQAALNSDSRTLAEQIVGRELDLCIFSKKLRERISRMDVVRNVEDELNKYGSTDNCLAYFYLMNRTRRSIALSPFRLLINKVETFLPFLENDLFDFVMSVPIPLKMSHSLRKDLLEKGYPELSDIEAAVDRNNVGAKIGWQHHPSYLKQRRQYFRHCVQRHYLRMNWAFRNTQAGPRILKDGMSYLFKERHISYVFNEGFSTFYDFLGKYYPDGLE